MARSPIIRQRQRNKELYNARYWAADLRQQQRNCTFRVIRADM
jgi:hypothetical protein